MKIGRVEALLSLGLQSQDWGPAYADEYPHQVFAEHWRGTSACPTEAEISAAIAAIVEESRNA